MEQFLIKNWNLKAPKIIQIEGYSNSNFKIEDSGKKYIQKMYPNEKHLTDRAETENKLLLWLNKKAEDSFPFPVLTKEAQTFLYDAEKRNIFRLLTWLDGDFWFEVKSQRNCSVSPILSVSYKKPVYMERAAFQYMFDKYSNSYLDAYNNIPHVGHAHPKVVEAGQKQMARLNTNTRYLYDNLNEYIINLLNYFPKPLNKVFLVNSGSAATDLALRMARHFTGRQKVAVVEHGYHGNTQAGIEISHYKFSGKGRSGPSQNVLCLPIPDTYRGEFRVNDGKIPKFSNLSCFEICFNFDFGAYLSKGLQWRNLIFVIW